jgi:hypothetical protein
MVPVEKSRSFLPIFAPVELIRPSRLADRIIEGTFAFWKSGLRMKRSLLAIAIVFGWTVEICASSPAPLATLRAVHALSNDEASGALPVAFEATITYLPDYEKAMFVQDGGDAIYVEGAVDPALKVGDRVLVKGATRDSFRPYIIRGDITLLHHGPL